MGMGGDDAVCLFFFDVVGGIAPFGGAVAGAACSGVMPGDLAAGGTPSNLGKIGNAGKFSFELSICPRSLTAFFFCSSCGC